MAVSPDCESQMSPLPPRSTAAAAIQDQAPQDAAGGGRPPMLSAVPLTRLSVREGVALSYRVNLTVEAKIVSDSGKTQGGTTSKRILDDACGTVSPKQVCVCVCVCVCEWCVWSPPASRASIRIWACVSGRFFPSRS